MRSSSPARDSGAGQVLGPRRADRRTEDPGARERRRRGTEQGAEHRRSGDPVEDADACQHGRRPRKRSRRRSRPTRAAPRRRSPTRSGRRRRSSSRSRRRSSAPRAPAGRSSMSSGAVRKRFAEHRRSGSSTSRSTRTTIRRRGRTAGSNEWKLPSEPFTFLVGADGHVKERFEGTFSVRELTAAVERELSASRVRASRPRRSRPTRSITTCGMRALGLSLRHMRTTSAQSSGWIISSPERPANSAIGVSTNPGTSRSRERRRRPGRRSATS